MHTFLGSVGTLAVFAGLADPAIAPLIVLGVVMICLSYYFEGND